MMESNIFLIWKCKNKSRVTVRFFGALKAIFFILFSCNANAENFYWAMDYSGGYRGNTPEEACQDLVNKLGWVSFRIYSTEYSYVKLCNFNHMPGNYWVRYGTRLKGDSCPEGSSYDLDKSTCISFGTSRLSKQKGEPDSKSCTAGVASNSAGNPINIATGNKYQREVDYVMHGATPLSFGCYYNSTDGVWAHTYSTHLSLDATMVTLISADGAQSAFHVINKIASGEQDQLGKLVKSGNIWVYTSPANEISTFNSAGRLISIRDRNGLTQTLTYGTTTKNITSVSVTDSLGNTLGFSQDASFRPVELRVPDLTVTYKYNESNQLYRAEKSRSGQVESRTYHYEVAGKPLLLTGITDERGVRYATWEYDDQGRATSSEHAGGAGKVHISYNVDGTSTVTNELGRQTLYRYQVIQSVKHIVAVEGEPSANCPASNSTYTYNDRGQVLTKTDAKGFITTYAYNDRGLETSRTEASGTPQARTTTTTWHATFNLPLTVTEGGQVTTYTYDAQGRQTSRTQSAL